MLTLSLNRDILPSPAAGLLGKLRGGRRLGALLIYVRSHGRIGRYAGRTGDRARVSHREPLLAQLRQQGRHRLSTLIKTV